MSFLGSEKKELSLCSESLIEIIKAVTCKQKSLRMKVKGFSMSPFIKDSDTVTVSPVADINRVFGMAVAFINPCNNKLVIHRVIGECKCGKHYIIKGDNIPGIDGAIPKQNILGYVSKVKRGKRKISLGLGPERHIIAYLSRKGTFPSLWRSLVIVPRPVRRLFL